MRPSVRTLRPLNCYCCDGVHTGVHQSAATVAVKLRGDGSQDIAGCRYHDGNSLSPVIARRAGRARRRHDRRRGDDDVAIQFDTLPMLFLPVSLSEPLICVSAESRGENGRIYIRTDSTDSPNCSPILLSLSVSTF